MINDNRLELKEKFLAYFKEVPIQKYAGAWIGKSEDTITRWKEEDKDFADQIENAKAEFIKSKLGKIQSNEWILERLFKDHFAQRNELTGANGSKLLPSSLEDLKTNYGELANSITKQLEGQGVENDTPLQDKEQSGGAGNIPTESSPIETPIG